MFNQGVEESLLKAIEEDKSVSVRFHQEESGRRLKTVSGRLQSFGTAHLVFEKKGRPILRDSITEIWIGGETVFSRSGT
jgi:hypothetical protein